MTRGVSFDLERVEVLKGPQGTLFGQNSTGGAINYIAAKPTSEASAGFDLDYGRFNTVNAQAFISGTLAPNLRARLAVRQEYRDAWQIGYAPNDQQLGQDPNEKLGVKRFYTGRAILDWSPSDRLDFELNVNGWRDRSDTQASQFQRFVPNVPQDPFNGSIYAAFAGLNPLPANSRVAGWTAGNNYRHDDYFYQGSLRSTLNLDGVNLTAIGAYSRYHENGLTDYDGTAFAGFANRRVANIESESFEFRADGELGTGKWMLGVNYAHDDIREIQSPFTNITSGGVGPFRYTTSTSPISQKVDTYAVFGNLEQKLTDTLTLAGSGRYTKQDRNFAGCLADSGDGQLATAFGAAFGTPTSIGNCVTMASAVPPFIIADPVRDSLNEDNFSWRANLSWKATANTLLYANVSKGYKSGAYSLLPAAFAQQLAPVTQESVLAYEAGFKSSVAGRKIDVNGSIFYYDYADKQVLGTVAIQFFGNLPKLINIPKSRVTGAELNITVRPTTGLTLASGVAYVDSKVLRAPAGASDPLGSLVNITGEAFPNTPRWQASGDAEYRFPVAASGTTAFLGGNLSYRSKAQAAFGNLSDFVIPAYTIVDLRAGLEAADGSWRFQIWGQNITNKFYLINVDRVADQLTRTTGMPVTYGATLSYRFN